jgi:hypothetical protein
MAQAAGKTGVGPAISVAVEQHFPQINASSTTTLRIPSLATGPPAAHDANQRLSVSFLCRDARRTELSPCDGPLRHRKVEEGCYDEYGDEFSRTDI